MASWFKRASSSEPANAAAAQGKPLLLIGYDEAAGQWRVGQEAIAMLQGVAGPLCTVSVCGRARQGKSFLLNQVLGRLTGVDRPKGFAVSPTHQSCTRGIWLWSAPIAVVGPDGRKCNTLLMDCEGVDAVDQGAQHSAQIFSLSMLLSSIFVYNQVGAIDAIAIERLAMVCELARRIKDRSAGAGHSNGAPPPSLASGQVDFSPAFLWLLRDFQLQLRGADGPISPAEYLEEALLPLQGSSADIANRNQMRSTIKAVFPDRDVATLVRPALSEAELQRLDTLTWTQLRPEFRKDMEALMGRLKSKVRPLAVGGTLVNGVALAGLATAYVSAVNQGAVPQLVTAWQGVSRAECQRAYEAAVAAYEAAFKEDGTTDEAALYEAHQAALKAALTAFKAAAMGEPELVGEFEGRLRSGLEGRYVEARRKLAASGERLAQEMLAAESTKLRALMSRPDASVEAVESELRRFLDVYDLQVPSGPHKYKQAAEFLMNTIISGIKGIVRQLIAARDAAASKAAAAEATAGQLRAEVARLGEAEARSTAAQQELLAAQQDAARLSGQAEAKARHIATLEGELSQLRAAQVTASADAAKAGQELSAARAEASRLQAQLASAAALSGEAERLRAQLADAATREAAAQQAKAAAQQEATSLAGQLSSAQGLVSRLQSEAAAGRSELSDLRAQVTDLKQQLAAAEAAAANVQVEDSHIRGQLDEERRKVTAQMQEVARLTADLAKERGAHDTTRAQLDEARAASRASLRSPTAAAGPSAAAAAGATPATGRATGGRSKKRQRTAGDDDESAMDAEEAAPAMPAAAETPAAAPASAAPAASTPVNTDINPDKMTVAELKAWVTDNRIEDDAFFKMSQASKTKKADWVKYVKQKLAAAS